ncbi:X-Pro dipeptidyl-peptidase [Saccharopolyspora erythraea]|uniref:CocE/NonD family hydrolase n=1 Tax=Saccharopolyspora erythraea TaxID=1836 RepID=UPI001BAD5566|nr:CocE/NonD family hydrolase [Saccharopolyspora erythraea]QUH00279.1 X-Pro dipeptidyl-peptidase [Saccharopolyspora erythraea]
MRRLLTLATAAVVAALAVPVVPPTASTAPPGVTVRHETIPGADGVALDAKVIEPAGDGPFPLLVMPASWATPNLEYVGAAADLAYNSGYVVVTYTARGFWASGGAVEVAGAEDVADASKVIDWAVANTGADPGRVGMAGISYGAGISALTAAADPRVRAVSAMSGWADLEKSLYPNGTVNAQGSELLLGAGHLTGRFGSDLAELERAYREGRIEDALHLVPERSPATVVDAINANGTAVMIANAWEDSLFPPQQMADLYEDLRGPKRLMLSPGDHATPEIFGAAGLPNDVWDSTRRWFDHHLRDVPNGIGGENPVRLKPINGGPWRGYPDWDSVTGRVDTRYLGAPEPRHPLAPVTGGLTTQPGAGWQHSISAEVPTLADSGPVMISGILQGFGIPVGVFTPLVDRRGAGVWATDPYPRAVTVSGTPRLSTTVTSDSDDTTLFAYLYDVDAFGAGSLISHKPVTLHGGASGGPQRVELALEPGLWTVPAGHRLVLVVDTLDPRYGSSAQAGSRVGFDSPAGAPSRLDIPLG